MKIKEIYPVLLIILMITLILTVEIGQDKAIYAFSKIFAGESGPVEEPVNAEKSKETIEKITKTKLTLKEELYHGEDREGDKEPATADIKASRSGFRFSRTLDMIATAYDLSYESCGKYPDHPEYGITASGTKVQPGTVAVDPDVIPLGTRLYIASTDGTPDYGFATALDTGSAIKGYRVDLFMENKEDALAYGIRQVKVYILE
jgi:3D (Asp-Asp-Asp) domain-containing protein